MERLGRHFQLIDTMSNQNRYTRQMMMPEIGEEGQRRLAEARVLIVGAGGLGSPIALYLAGAGIGNIGLIDGDAVSVHNLQRQILYTEKEIGQKKVHCAQKRLEAFNSDVKIDIYNEFLSGKNANDIIGKYDIIVDGSDNFATRYLINDTCLALHKVYVYGSVSGFRGQAAVFNLNGSPINYRTLFPEEEEIIASENCEGIIGAVPGVVGCTMAMEVIKIVCGIGTPLDGRLWTYNFLTNEQHIFEI